MPSSDAPGADRLSDHPRSYYAATAADRTVRAPVAGEVVADVCIVGAGFTPKQMRELEHQKRDWEARGHDGLRIVGRTELADIVASDRYVGGLVDRHGGHLHPLNLVLGEAAAVEHLGGRIFEQSPA